MKKKDFFKTICAIGVLVTVGIQQVWGCTSVIVSGRVTKDGRPIIFKNRDTDTSQNAVIVVQGKRYRYIGLVNAADKNPNSVWGGHNEKGFAIINTAAKNLNGVSDTTHCDGVMMRRALENCATLADFEHLLDTIAKPMDVNSNFGVMDALGGCAYYETSNYTYTKFDANDPAIAPDGYLMRTNFGTTGNHELDKGVERYYAITDFMENAKQTNRFEADYLVTAIPRYLRHGVTKMDMHDFMPENDTDTCMFCVLDYIPRYSTASVILIQGVRPNETPENTISWTIVGHSLTTVCIPLMLNPSGHLPSVVTTGDDGLSRLNSYGLTLKEQLFCMKRGDKISYINLTKLLNKQGTGILQLLQPVEQEIIKRGNEIISILRRNPQDAFPKMDAYYDWVDQYVTESYHQLFGL